MAFPTSSCPDASHRKLASEHANDPVAEHGERTAGIMALAMSRPTIMSCINQISALVLAADALVGVASNAAAQVPAQGNDQQVRIDCSAFQKGSDGSWTATRQTTITIGTNSITNSGGITPRGSVNGIAVQDAIDRQCSQAASMPAGGAGKVAPVYANNSWLLNTQTLPECLARAGEMVQGFSWTASAGEAVYAQFDGFRFIIRCTPRKVVFFAIVGPPGSTQERNQIAQDLFDRIKKGFLSESSAR